MGNSNDLASTEVAIKIALVRTYPHLPDRAIDMLAAAAKETVEWGDVLAGSSLNLKAILDGIKHTVAGEVILGERDEAPATNGLDLAELSKLRPVDRINQARKLGLR